MGRAGESREEKRSTSEIENSTLCHVIDAHISIKQFPAVSDTRHRFVTADRACC